MPVLQTTMLGSLIIIIFFSKQRVRTDIMRKHWYPN